MPAQPNIILMMCDDLGYGDLGCYGSEKVSTPHVDLLAREGVLFTTFYGAAPVCSPTRASCLTGCYPLRFDIRDAFGGGAPWGHPREMHLPLVQTLPKLLKQAGYQTAHVGKWHLGGDHADDFYDRRRTSVPGPAEHGFDHYLTNLHGDRWTELYQKGFMHRSMAQERLLLRNGVPINSIPAHSQDVLTSEAIDLLDSFSKKKRPFFLNFWFYLPHTTLEPSPEPYLAPYVERAKGCDLLYRSMVSHIDSTVGKVMDKLHALGMVENTIVIFTSDHGPSHCGDNRTAGPGSAGNLRNGKHDLHEGGLRVPLVVRWPAQIKPCQTINTPVHVIDFVPTLCAAAGVNSLENIDGINLLEHWCGAGPATPERPLLFQMESHPRPFYYYPMGQDRNPTEAVRLGDWKLLTRNGTPIELYNLQEDTRESWNLLNDEPERVRQLAEHIREFLAAPRIAGVSGECVRRQ